MQKLFLIGQVIDDRYQVKTELGRGGFGSVYLADHLTFDREVVLKFLGGEHLKDEQALARFQLEARVIAALRHKNIVLCYSQGLWAKRVPYLAFEYVEGKTVREILNAGPLGWKRAVAISAGIAEGLAHAHASGIVHRDIKPENILVTAEGLPKVIDFGLAWFGDQHLTQAGTVVGTAVYMSPEQCCGKQPTAQSDIYSLGCVLYEMITGTPPFHGEDSLSLMKSHCMERYKPVSSIISDVPAGVENILSKMLSKNESTRYLDAADVAKDLLAASCMPNVGGASNVTDTAPAKRERQTAYQWTSTYWRVKHRCNGYFLASILAVALVGISIPIFFSNDATALPVTMAIAKLLPATDREKFYKNSGDFFLQSRRPNVARLLYQQALVLINRQTPVPVGAKISRLRDVLRCSLLDGRGDIGATTTECLSVLDSIARMPNISAAQAESCVDALCTVRQAAVYPRVSTTRLEATEALVENQLHKSLRLAAWARLIAWRMEHAHEACDATGPPTDEILIAKLIDLAAESEACSRDWADLNVLRNYRLFGNPPSQAVRQFIPIWQSILDQSSRNRLKQRVEKPDANFIAVHPWIQTSGYTEEFRTYIVQCYSGHCNVLRDSAVSLAFPWLVHGSLTDAQRLYIIRSLAGSLSGGRYEYHRAQVLGPLYDLFEQDRSPSALMFAQNHSDWMHFLHACSLTRNHTYDQAMAECESVLDSTTDVVLYRCTARLAVCLSFPNAAQVPGVNQGCRSDLLALAIFSMEKHASNAPDILADAYCVQMWIDPQKRERAARHLLTLPGPWLPDENAFKALAVVQDELEHRGRHDEAQKLGQDIIRFKERAQTSHI